MNDHPVQTLNEMLGIDDDHVDPTVIRELAIDKYAQVRDEHLSKQRGEVWLGVDSALPALATADTITEMHFHREHCPILMRSDIHRFSVPHTMALRVGFTFCTHCSDLSLDAWAIRRGVDPDLMHDLFDGKLTRLHKSDAIAVLRAIGEPSHASLKAWQRGQIAA